VIAVRTDEVAAPDVMHGKPAAAARRQMCHAAQARASHVVVDLRIVQVDPWLEACHGRTTTTGVVA
jgi:hypothetical protein